MFKSGTHLIRELIELITMKSFQEPIIIRGKNNYEDQEKFFVPGKGKFFSWHLHPKDSTSNFIVSENIKSIYLVRNIFDQTISIYNHFAKNIDHEIGRARNVDHLFKNISYENGLKLIVDGCDFPEFKWLGLEHQLLHLERLYKSSVNTNGLFLSYEQLILNKEAAVTKICDYLGYEVKCLDHILTRSEFAYMKKVKHHKSHFQKGKIGTIFEKNNKMILPYIQKKVSEYEMLNIPNFTYLFNDQELRALLAKGY